MKPTLTILHDKSRITLFRLPKPGSVAHRQLGKGLSVWGDDDILQLPSALHDDDAECRLAGDRALGEVKIPTAPSWLLDYGAGSAARVIKVCNIKIADIVVGPNRRPLNPDKVAEIAESMAAIGQTNPTTVRARKDGKFDPVSGGHRIAAAKTLDWTEIRAQIVEGSEIDVRLWGIADDLHRAGLTALQEAERLAEWVQLIENREPVYRPKVVNPKGGRPEGPITKAARELPVKGSTPKARRKAIERAVKTAAISPDAKAALVEAGLADKPTALLQIAKASTPAAQLAKVKEIKGPKANSVAKGGTHGFGKKTKGGTKKDKRLPAQSSLSKADERVVSNLLEMWHDARKLKRAFAKASMAVRERFVEELLQSVADEDNDPDLEPNEQEDEQEDEQEGELDGEPEDNDDDDLDGNSW
jgi:ParB-like chromosome segregation protein Spo0J